MRILVLEPSARDQHAGVDQGLDHRLVGVAFLALFGQDALAGKAGRLIGEAAVGIDGVGNVSVDAFGRQSGRIGCPYFEVLATMSRRRVNEAGARVVGDVIAGKERNEKVVIAGQPFERMRAAEPADRLRRQLRHLFERRDPRLPQHIERKLAGQHIFIADFGPISLRRIGDLIKAIFDGAANS